MAGYDNERKGLVLNDGNLIRVQDKNNDGNVRISIYDGNERMKGEHSRDSINIDTNTGTGRIDSHNDNKSEETSTDISCYLTSACMKFFQEQFDDNCHELTTLRWFRDNFVTQEDKEHYYEVAPNIVDAINNEKHADMIYKYIYDNVVDYCVKKIKNGKYDEAYSRYKISILSLEERYLKPTLGIKLVKNI